MPGQRRSSRRSRSTSRSRSGSRSGSRRQSALNRARHNITLRGRRANNVRAPQGMPMESNYNPIHRLGSRVRSYSQRLMQQDRQLMRRRPHIAALRLAHSRPLNA